MNRIYRMRSEEVGCGQARTALLEAVDARAQGEEHDVVCQSKGCVVI
jgi:hypothetical protein